MLKNNTQKLNIGVIGYGYWGPNIVRNFAKSNKTIVKLICDLNPNSLSRAKKDFPQVSVTNKLDKIFESSSIQAVAIVTPVSTHYKIAKQALYNDKHLFVEKPFTSTSKEGLELIKIASSKKLKIMVDHTFLFTGGVLKIKELINKNILGKILYFDSTRINLGLLQNDINVIWDLAPHDFSIMDFLIKERPTHLSAVGSDHFRRGFEDVAYVNLFFKSNMIAHFNFNWISPVKIRSTIIGGSKKMIIWNDLETNEKIKLYDKGVKINNKDKSNKLLVDYRFGDMWSPKIELTEALETEANYFADCINNNIVPINDGWQGLRIVKMLEATNKSLKNNGEIVSL